MRTQPPILKGLVLILLCVSCIGCYKLYNQTKGQESTLVKQETQISQDKNSIASLKKDLSKVQTDLHNEKIKKNNDDPNSKLYAKYDQTARSLIEKLYTFDPENYRKRKSEASPYMSDSLIDEYFKETAGYSDSSNVTSSVIKIELFNQSIQDESLHGLAVIKYESGLSNTMTQSVDIYKLSFDPDSNKITELSFISGGLTGDLFE